MKLSEHGVITEEALLAYLNNTLSAEEKKEMETLLKGDPFAQEALEGLRNDQDLASVSASLASINSQVKERVGMKERKVVPLQWTRYAFAAAIFGLIIAIGFIMVNYIGKSNQDIAMNKNAKNEDQNQTVSKQKTEESKPAPSGQTTIPDSGVMNNPANVLPEKDKSTVPSSTESKLKEEEKPKDKNAGNAEKDLAQKNNGAVITGKGSTSPPATINSTLTANNNNAAAPSGGAYTVNTKQQVSDKLPPKNQKDSVQRKTETKKEQKPRGAEGNPSSPNIDEAMKTFYAGDYKKSSEQFDEVLKQKPNSPDALYFGGISDYINGNSEKGEKNFDQLLHNGTKFIDGSKWYKANILIRKGNRDEAKKLLDELSVTGGSYKERAKKKLTEMGY